MSGESSVEKGRGENVYNIRQGQVDIINERIERDNGLISDMVGAILVMLMLCQLFALLAVLSYGLYEHNVPSNIVLSNMTTEYFNSTSLYPIKVLNGSHVWRNYTWFKNE